MPEYLVTTHDNRNLIVESDYFEHNNSDSYDFFTKEEGKTRVLVASINAHSVLGVVEYEEAFKADFYDDGPEDDEPSDICLGCEFKELLGSEDFFNAVYDIVDSYHEPDGPEPLTVFKATVKGNGNPTPQWGFWFEDKEKGSVFVNFSEKEYAEEGLEAHKKLSNPEGFWGTHPLSNVIPVEETIQ